MQNTLQKLTDKLYEEGLSKGKQEGEEIVSKAKVQAEAILADAKSQAEAILAKAQKEADDLKSKVASDVKMAASESLAATRQSIEKLIVTEICEKPVKEALTSEDFVKEVIKAVAARFSSEESTDLDIVLPETLKNAVGPFVENELASILGRGVSARYSKKIAAGFQIGPKDGAWYISLTDESFTELIGSYLRSATRQILFG